MTYSAAIDRQNPTCFVFIVDQSGSMGDSLDGSESAKKKADSVADAINNLLRELTVRCAKAEGVRDYFHISAIGYGATVGPAFSGPLSGKEIVPISQVAENPARVDQRTRQVENGVGGLVNENIKFPVWFEPVANNGTPMCKAFKMATSVVQSFVSKYPNSFPPIVIHLTDGESTDGDPTGAMRELTSISTSDGNVLLFNCHISSSTANQIKFPQSSIGLPDMYARMLFDNSSELTPKMIESAKNFSFDLPLGSKCFVFNADSVLIIQVLEIGTRSVVSAEFDR